MSTKTKFLGLRTAVTCGALGAMALGNAACVRDTDCGICDPDNLILESISGLNYASNKVHFLNPTCEGDSCPEPRKRGSYFVEEIVPCPDAEETEDFINGLIRDGELDADETSKIARFKEEYCKISPLVVAFGIEFVFNNLLEPSTVELVRKRPDQPKLFEVYQWKTRILDIVGPTTRYNGDFVKGATDEPDVITRLVNLTCVQNLAEEGIPFTNESYENPLENPCNTTREVDGDLVPWKMRIGTDDARLQSYRGIWTGGGNSCSTPQDGADTCCTECDFLLGTRIAKYGVASDGETKLSPNDGTAITCDAEAGDPLIDCRGFVPSVDRREEEARYDYYWDCPPGSGECDPVENDRRPMYDRLRETHPDDRPAWIEDNRLAACSDSTQCEEVHGLPGTQCIGVDSMGRACLPGAMTTDCGEGRCRSEWWVACAAPVDTTGGSQGYCVDIRFSDAGAAACYTAEADFDGQCDEDGDCNNYNDGQRLANCNSDTNDAIFSAAECCQEALGGVDISETDDGIQCDPYFQPEIRAVARYDRDENLPPETRGCVCKPLDELSDEEAELCTRTIREVCYDGDGNFMSARDGEYAVNFVQRPGGVVYDPAIKGVEWRPGDIGGVPRARIEQCSEDRAGGVGLRNRLDGWRANDAFQPELVEDFDRAMCSGQEYTVTFAVPGADEFIEDKVGNSMEGHAEYTFVTPQFHVVPGSGFPTDNLRVGACDLFSIRFSNKYDMSPENQRKLAIYRVDVGDPDDANDDTLTTPVGNPDDPRSACSEVVPVAGGPGCYATEIAWSEALASNPCAAPCLTVDIADQFTGEVRVQVDPVEFGVGLELRERYRLLVPSLGDIEQMSDPNAYYSAFWDACGMPLVAQDAAEYSYDFTIDEPKCKEDRDRDGVQRSCDNAEKNFNPDQGDIDRDGVGDVIDKCPTVANAGNSNSADSDKDGVGNDCDVCRQTTAQYNDHDNAIAVPDYMLVRNIPWQGDADDDGIGDVCDNCVQVANCEGYGPSNPFEVGDPIDVTNENTCQRDDNSDLIGDICEPMTPDDPPVGIAPDDDFDGDLLPNISDLCPRQPAPAQTCTASDDCPTGSACDTAVGACNHIDSDGDGVGDICDTCPFVGNPNQTMDGTMQEEDEDGDFVGNVCETNNACAGTADSRPFAFYEVSANGQCCTVQLTDDGAGNLVNAITGLPLLDPYDHPVRLDCEEAEELEMSTCRQLPMAVATAPGVLSAPPGCEEALAAAGITALENPRLTLDDVDGSLDALWNTVCFLPQVDQDYDGLGDPCDFCPFDYDPSNEVYKDENGRLWPGNGAFCNGEFSEENRCEGAAEDEGGTAGTDETAGTEDESGGMETTGGADTTGG